MIEVMASTLHPKMTVSRRIFISLLLLGLLTPSTAQPEVYKWVDENGRVHYSDTAPREDDSQTEVVELEDVVTYTHTSVYDGEWEFYKPPKHIKVVMYSTVTCGACKRAKKYFREKDIKFQERLLSNPRYKAEFDKFGGRGVPVIFINGKRMDGFSKRSFDRLYAELNP
jgi:glutaredoxin